MVDKPECIYVASRLTAAHPLGYIKNLQESIVAGAEIWEKGHYPFVPGLDILLLLNVKNSSLEQIYSASIEWMKRCDAVFVLNGLDEPISWGVVRELKEAARLHLKIYMSLDEIVPVKDKI